MSTLRISMKFARHNLVAWPFGALGLFFPALCSATESAANTTVESAPNTPPTVATPSKTTDESKSRAAKVEVGLRTDFGFWETSIHNSPESVMGLFVGAEAFFRPIPYLGFGALAAVSVISSELGEGCIYGNRTCKPVTFRLGATLRAEPLPKSPVGPWLGLGLVYLGSSEGHSATNFEGTIGVDFRPSRISWGPYISASYIANFSACGGIRVAARF